MKIVYISHIKGNGTNGLCWSVPASVKAQSIVDDVFWLNIGKGIMDHWKIIPAFHNNENSSFSIIKMLPIEFKNPDVVVFEGVYDSLFYIIWGRELKYMGIPYIIIPRSALTESAMNNHARMKKKMAHFLFYNKFIKEAAAVHLLSNGEAQQTYKLFKMPYVVLPNGISIPSHFKTNFSDQGVNAVFIGRIDLYQKGLDILVRSIALNKESLVEKKFKLNIFGPKSKDAYILNDMCNKYGINNIVSIHNQITGKDKEDVLLSSDVFILTSRFEGLPMGLIEALSYGVPCAVTRGTYMGDEIEEAKAGWVSDISEESISSMLINVCNQKASFDIMGKNARILSLRFDWKAIAQKTHEEYQRIINK